MEKRIGVLITEAKAISELNAWGLLSVASSFCGDPKSCSQPLQHAMVLHFYSKKGGREGGRERRKKKEKKKREGKGKAGKGRNKGHGKNIHPHDVPSFLYLYPVPWLIQSFPVSNRESIYGRSVKLIFTWGHISLAVAFKALNVFLGLYKCNLLLNS